MRPEAEPAITQLADAMPEEASSALARKLRNHSAQDMVQLALDSTYTLHNPFMTAYIVSVVPESILSPREKNKLVVSSIEHALTNNDLHDHRHLLTTSLQQLRREAGK